VKRSDRGLGVISREKSFGQRLKFGQVGGNLCLWGPERFFSGVLNLESTYPLFGRTILNASLASLAGEDVLGLGVKKEEEQIASVMQWLRENHGWLLIFDNADSEEAAEAVEEKLPQLSNGRVIITSRYTRWSGAVSPERLGLLEEEKASEFLLERTAGRRIETEKDEEIAEKLARGAGLRRPLGLSTILRRRIHTMCASGLYWMYFGLTLKR